MLLLMVLSCLLLPSSPFNLAPEHADIISDPTGSSDSYFGFTVALQGGSEPRLVIGAPRGNTPSYQSLNTTRPGVVYSCPIREGNCSQILPGPPSDFIELKDTTDIYLGGSLDVEEKGSALVACAPRWSYWFNYTNCKIHDCFFGLCYYMQDVRQTDNVNQLNKEVKPENFFQNSKTRRYMIHRQAGMSVQFVQDGQEVLIGATGIDRGNGGFLKFDDPLRQDTASVIAPYQQLPQITDSYFGYSVGSGKFFGDGKIYYVSGAPRADYRGEVLVLDMTANTWSKVQELEGRQMGEYFGATVCVVDLNGDGLDDLLVGAPQHSSQSAWETGAVYIFLGKKGELEEHLKLTGQDAPGARFGMAITAAGDINEDGYADIAVGAPYESDGRGAVYLYHGKESGISPKYSQRLTAMSPAIRGFGMSVSRGLDVDGNHFNDIAVGAYQSGQVAVIKSYPVVRVQAALSSSIAKITPLISTLTVTSCVWYSPPRDKLEPIDVSVTVELDKTYRRATVNRGRRKYSYEQAINEPEKKECKDILVFVQPPNGMHYDTKPIDFTVVGQVPVQERKQFCSTCPVVDPDEIIESRLQVPVDLLCGDKAECSPDLQLHAEFTNVKRPYIIGSRDVILIKMTMMNKQEPAYHPQINISLSEGCRYRRIPSMCRVRKSGQVLCDVDRPLINNDKFDLILELDVSQMSINMSLLQVNLTATSLGNEQNENDNSVSLHLPVQADVDILMRGSSEPPEIVHESKSSEDEEESEKEEMIAHIYEFHNFGVTSPRQIEVTVRIPTAVCVDQSYMTIMNINSTESITDGLNLKCAVVAANHTSSCEYDMRELQVATLDVMCTMSQVLCSRVLCTGGPLPSLKEQQLTVYMRPELNHLNKLMGKNIVLHTVAETSIMDFVSQPDEGIAAEVTVKTVFHWIEHQQLTIWIIIGAVLGGLILLLFIVFILYRCGFFKRKKLPLHRALLNKDGNPSDDERYG